MKSLLVIISLIFIITLVFLIDSERRLDDYRFEVNHLQTKVYMLQEFSDYIPAMEQTLPPLVLAQLKTVTEMIRQKKYKEYERYEQPLLGN